MCPQVQIDLPKIRSRPLARPHSQVFKTAMQTQAGCGFEGCGIPLFSINDEAGGPIPQGVVYKFWNCFPPFPCVLPTEHAPIANLLLLFLLNRGTAMPNSDLLPSLLSKINENQLALEAAIMELMNWVGQQGGTEIADNVRGALDTIDRNEEFIKLTLAVLNTP